MVAVVGQLEPAGQREVLGQLDRVVLLPLVDQVVRRPTIWKVKGIKTLQGVPSGRTLGLVDLDLDCSALPARLPRLVGIWQKWLGSCAKGWNTQI